MNASHRKKVQRKCKITGCNLKVNAPDEILSFASHFEGPEEDEAIDLLLDNLHKSLKSTILNKEMVQHMVSLLLDANKAAEESSDAVSIAIRVIDVFLIPKHTGSLPIDGEASTKAALYRDKFLLLS